MRRELRLSDFSLNLSLSSFGGNEANGFRVEQHKPTSFKMKKSLHPQAAGKVDACQSPADCSAIQAQKQPLQLGQFSCSWEQIPPLGFVTSAMKPGSQD